MMANLNFKLFLASTKKLNTNMELNSRLVTTPAFVAWDFWLVLLMGCIGNYIYNQPWACVNTINVPFNYSFLNKNKIILYFISNSFFSSNKINHPFFISRTLINYPNSDITEKNPSFQNREWFRAVTVGHFRFVI